MSDDGGRVLTAIGVVIVLFILMAVAALVIAAASTTGTDVPDASWELDRINETHVRIVHAGGDAVDADRLVVSVDGYERTVTWSGEVGEGDGGSVFAQSGTEVTLYWTRERRPRTHLASWTV